MQRRMFLRATAASAGALGALAAPAAAAAPRRTGPPRFQVLMFEGVEEQDFVAPIEVLGLAAKMSKGTLAPPKLVSIDHPRTVTCTYGSRIEVPNGWSPEQADVLIVPGGGYTDKTGPGVNQLIKNEAFLAKLATVRAELAGICTGTMVLSAAGLTRGRNATTHHGAKADLAGQGTTVIDARVVDDGDLITGGGITSGLDVALWLVERFAGPKLAQRVEQVLEYERRGTVWRA